MTSNKFKCSITKHYIVNNIININSASRIKSHKMNKTCLAIFAMVLLSLGTLAQNKKAAKDSTTEESVEHKNVVILSGFGGLPYEAGSDFYKSMPIYGFSAGFTLIKNRFLISIEMDPRDYYTYHDQIDSLQVVKLSTLRLGLALNILPSRSKFFAGANVGVQAGEGYVKNKLIGSENPKLASAYIQFNFNWPQEIPVFDDTWLVGFFFRNTYDQYYGSEYMVEKNKPWFSGTMKVGINVILQ